MSCCHWKTTWKSLWLSTASLFLVLVGANLSIWQLSRAGPFQPATVPSRHWFWIPGREVWRWYTPAVTRAPSTHVSLARSSHMALWNCGMTKRKSTRSICWVLCSLTCHLERNWHQHNKQLNFHCTIFL